MRQINTHNSWKKLNSEQKVDELIEESKDKPVAIFKHSTTCGISHMVKDNIEAQYNFNENELSFYYLDLLGYRPVSNKVAQTLRVPHQSPQLILLKDGNVVYNASHHSINLDEVKTLLK